MLVIHCRLDLGNLHTFLNSCNNVLCDDSKASSVLALLYGVKNAGISKDDVEYVIDCAEEACGDMNQRGGGNFAKADISNLKSCSLKRVSNKASDNILRSASGSYGMAS